MARRFILFLALFTLWLLLSGHFKPLLLALGVLSCAVVVAIVHRLDVIDDEGVPLATLPFIWRYWPWLTKEIGKANWAVIRHIISPRLAISPEMVRFRPTQRTTTGLVTHANSITLTPGTVTVEIEEDGCFLVHALTREIGQGAAATVGGERIEAELGQRITALEA